MHLFLFSSFVLFITVSTRHLSQETFIYLIHWQSLFLCKWEREREKSTLSQGLSSWCSNGKVQAKFMLRPQRNASNKWLKFICNSWVNDLKDGWWKSKSTQYTHKKRKTKKNKLTHCCWYVRDTEFSTKQKIPINYAVWRYIVCLANDSFVFYFS